MLKEHLWSNREDITAETRLVALLGHPVRHSHSPLMMNHAFRMQGLNYRYLAFDVAPAELEGAVHGLKSLGAVGWNVTIPHKVAMCSWMDELDETAACMGAVNTVVCRNGKWIGYNTDGEGYVRSLVAKTGISLKGQRVLILGAGGAARAVAHALASYGIEAITIVNRTRAKAEELLDSLSAQHPSAPFLSIKSTQELQRLGLSEYTLLVQTTSVGMVPHSDQSPIDPALLHDRLVVSDLIYKPHTTPLLQAAKLKGARLHHGIGMLIHQAALAYHLWTGKEAPLIEMEKVVLES
ncbi:shikimate dehydrogenase [Mechercharimyces sp. CAU 1602]|uniref:shikimate dehydrogenase n=1 Tax=Mechercharimyces sp. CAU 1602 TaxID=2973933 RepID=UPI00216332A9|nr:shikimate dehydrogenase [Mechercharimyces sp. CAU 1602]MCS1350403.1 shikimate dehydrogenase [Mechercharimyces sp. CAU 1602]